MENIHAIPGDLGPDIKKLIEDRLFGADDFDRLRIITEMIETFSRDVPAYLAELRVQWVRRLSETYTMEELVAQAGMSPSRIRKLLER